MIIRGWGPPKLMKKTCKLVPLGDSEIFSELGSSIIYGQHRVSQTKLLLLLLLIQKSTHKRIIKMLLPWLTKALSSTSAYKWVVPSFPSLFSSSHLFFHTFHGFHSAILPFSLSAPSSHLPLCCFKWKWNSKGTVTSKFIFHITLPSFVLPRNEGT